MKKVLVSFILTLFLLNTAIPSAYAGEMFTGGTSLPLPSALLSPSEAFIPAELQGLRVDDEDPFRFEFLVDPGDTGLSGGALAQATNKSFRYFFTGLTVSEKDLWVNLSPVEADRIIPEAFGRTDLGRDILAVDYVLKQLTASSLSPETDTGKKFWAEVYRQASEKFGTIDVPTDTFHKVWIVSEKAEVYEQSGAVYIKDSSLDVLLEEDYWAASGNAGTLSNNVGSNAKASQEGSDTASVTTQIMREIILPVLKKEVNEGESFAALRQANRALILAAWYKMRLKEGLLSRVYVDGNKTGGVEHSEKQAAERIYQQYLLALKKGVANFIKEEQDPISGEMIPKKYFSGGVTVMPKHLNFSDLPPVESKRPLSVAVVEAMPKKVSDISEKGGSDLAQGVISSIIDRAISFLDGFRIRQRLLLITAITGMMATTYAAPANNEKMSGEIANALVALGDPSTGLAPSHIGMPGFENIAFAYDKSVDAMVLNAAGKKREAHRIMDLFAGMLRDKSGATKDHKGKRGFMNAIDTSNGGVTLEYYVTPGPNAFMAMAFLNVDKDHYLPQAVQLGELLLTMQKSDGGVTLGDQLPNVVSVEPHMDAISVFDMLYEATGDTQWKKAADKGWEYFKANLFVSPGQILRGPKDQTFATDGYSWSMLGRSGDRFSTDEIVHLSSEMLRRSLTRVKVKLPGGEIRELTLVDFTDPDTSSRGGFYPMGSVEWMAGVVLAYQKNSVRFWNTGDESRARSYKAMAEYLSEEMEKAFYSLPGVSGKISFYATGEGIATGHGWNTPIRGEKGASSISSWAALAFMRVNPFRFEDNYGDVYDQINISEAERGRAKEFVDGIVERRSAPGKVKDASVIDQAEDSTVDFAANNEVGGIDLSTIKPLVTTENGAITQFVFDEGLLSRVREGLAGFEPVVVSTMPLADIDAFFTR